MSDKTDQMVEAVAKLLELTQEGKLLWEPSQSVTSALVARHLGQILRIRKLRPQFYNEPPPINLEILKDSGDVAWLFPEVEGLDDLYQAASYQASGAKDFLRDLLRED